MKADCCAVINYDTNKVKMVDYHNNLDIDNNKCLGLIVALDISDLEDRNYWRDVDVHTYFNDHWGYLGNFLIEILEMNDEPNQYGYIAFGKIIDVS